MGVTGLAAPRAARRRARLALSAAAVLALAAPASAAALANPAEMLTYMPTELVHSEHTPAQVQTVLGELAEYDIGQALFQMPRFKGKGTLEVPASNELMLRLWSQQAAQYDAEHGAAESVTAVFNGRPKAKGLDLELASTRARMVASVEAQLGDGISGVQLDIEPFPHEGGFIALLEELDAAFARAGFHGRLSVVAPAETSTWPPEYVQRVGALVDQVDPTFYESELASAAEYSEWVQAGLAYYSANLPADVRLVPVIPSYKSNAWHDAQVENIATATSGLQAALAAGSRVDGAGIWWWYAFYEEAGHDHTAADRAAWLSSTLELPFTP